MVLTRLKRLRLYFQRGSMAVANGWSKIIIEGDARSVVTKLTRKELDYSVVVGHLGGTVEHLKTNSNFTIAHVGRDRDRVTHHLAQWIIRVIVTSIFDFEVSDYIHLIVLDDIIFGN
ncbi:hypothetical protein V6N12_006300 [Hibiscus sabdariffa]|uniref:RNase H type-1 domain-containing protein n=1 Tax=Hibiscus sabdariffa TaxID=183260 RepID=A0ABR2EYE6_9ROSI